MLKTELKERLAETRLFSPCEITEILQTVGAYTMGCAVIACEAIGIVLSGSDVDIMFGQMF